MSRSTEEQDSEKSRGRPEGLPKRWSAQRRAASATRGRPAARVYIQHSECRPFDAVSRLFQYGGTRHDLTAKMADRAVPIGFRRFFACAVERRAFLAGANPARQLSLQPVAARAVCGGNDMS